MSRNNPPFLRSRPTASPALALAALIVAASVSAAASVAQSAAPTPTLRVTEVTEDTHPFDTLHCARQLVRVRFIDRMAEVVVNGESRLLTQAMSASGARYVAPGDDTTELWNKGSFGMLTWSGEELPLCAPSGSIIPPYRASGNEPFWAVSYDGWRATLKQPGRPDLADDARISDTSSRGQTLTAGQGAASWQLEAQDGLCVDSMSGMPRPQHASVHVDSRTLHGCGGDPDRLLQGASWRITQIGDRAANESAPATIRFLADGKTAGGTGCNLFFGRYTLTGEGLRFEDMGSTRKACAPDLTAQEDALFTLLGAVNGFSFEGPEARHLRLHAEGADIRARLIMQTGDASAAH